MFRTFHIEFSILERSQKDISSDLRSWSCDDALLSPDKQPLRHFNRMFVVVRQGNGFCIVNDMLHVTLPTLPDAKRAFSS